eukprot:497316_1
MASSIFFILLLCVATAQKCDNIADCSYNGECKNHICECFPQWKGNHCAQLNLIPGTRTQGFHSYVNGERVSTWGGGVVKGSDNNYHMIAAEMSEFCGINLWLSNSIIVHSMSRTFNGTYNRTTNAIVDDLFSHEPNIVKALDTNEYAIFFTHQYPPPTFKYPCTHCKNGISNQQLCPQTDNEYGRDWTKPLPTQMIYIKDIANGIWSDPIDIPTPSSDLPDCEQSPDNKQCIDSNLACYIYPNGSLVGLGRGDDGYYLATATNWKDNSTYKNLYLDGKFPDNCCGEDPFVWFDKRYNVLHAIWHFGGWGNPYGIHTFSTNGGYDWNGYMNAEHAYTQYVYFTDETNITLNRCERPHLIIGDDGYTPLALTNAAQEGNSNGDDYSYTLLRPINQK